MTIFGTFRSPARSDSSVATDITRRDTCVPRCAIRLLYRMPTTIRISNNVLPAIHTISTMNEAIDSIP